MGSQHLDMRRPLDVSSPSVPEALRAEGGCDPSARRPNDDRRDHVALRLRDVSKRFGATSVLEGVSLDVPKGSFVSLLGPSGCGKTTLLRIVAGFERPDRGRVEIDGASVDHLGPAARNLGMVFQNYALFPNMTVAQNIGFPLRFRPVPDPRAEVRRLISVVRLDGLEARYPTQLSGGQQQRVAFARAIAANPRLVLLDEPLSALDARVRQELRDELKRLQRETGLTLIYVTHDQEEALALSDRIALMNNGRIEQVGDPRDIYFRPKTRFAASFIGRSNLLSGSFGQDAVRLTDGTSLPPLGPWRGTGTLVVRPEMMKRDPEGPLEAIVQTVSFVGSGVEVVAASSAGPLRLLLSAGEPVQEGERLRLAIRPDAAWIPEGH